MQAVFRTTLVVMFLFPIVLFAHGEGASYEAEINGYFVDIGYDPATVVSGERVRFDFNTYPLENERATTSFTDVWVSIEQNGELIFSGGVHKPVFGATGFNITLPSAGEYEVKARFQNSGEKVVEASFPLVVTEGPMDTQQPVPQGITSLFVAALVALIVGFAVGRKTTHGA